MTEGNRDPQEIQAELESVEEYQAPPRAKEQDIESLEPRPAGDSADVTLLEAQQGQHMPTMSDPKPHAAPDPETTVSTRDERADPADPQAPPPGERM